MSMRFVKWKTDLEKSVIIENFNEENFLRAEDSTHIIKMIKTGTSIGLVWGM